MSQWFANWFGAWFGTWFGGDAAAPGEITATGTCGASGTAAALVQHRTVTAADSSGLRGRPWNSRPRRFIALLTQGWCQATGWATAGTLARVSSTGTSRATSQAHAGNHRRIGARGSQAPRAHAHAGTRTPARSHARPGTTHAQAQALTLRTDHDGELLALICALDHHHRMAA